MVLVIGAPDEVRQLGARFLEVGLEVWEVDVQIHVLGHFANARMINALLATRDPAPTRPPPFAPQGYLGP